MYGLALCLPVGYQANRVLIGADFFTYPSVVRPIAMIYPLHIGTPLLVLAWVLAALRVHAAVYPATLASLAFGVLISFTALVLQKSSPAPPFFAPNGIALGALAWLLASVGMLAATVVLLKEPDHRHKAGRS